VGDSQAARDRERRAQVALVGTTGGCGGLSEPFVQGSAAPERRFVAAADALGALCHSDVQSNPIFAGSLRGVFRPKGAPSRRPHAFFFRSQPADWKLKSARARDSAGGDRPGPKVKGRGHGVRSSRTKVPPGHVLQTADFLAGRFRRRLSAPLRVGMAQSADRANPHDGDADDFVPGSRTPPLMT